MCLDQGTAPMISIIPVTHRSQTLGKAGKCKMGIIFEFKSAQRAFSHPHQMHTA